MKKRIGFLYKGKKFLVDVVACNSFGKLLGLMFKERGKARALLFEFKKPTKMRIHSFFVFFPFIAIWLDEKNKIVDFRVVKPFNLAVSSKKPFKRLVEIPINERYRDLIKLLKPDYA